MRFGRSKFIPRKGRKLLMLLCLTQLCKSKRQTTSISLFRKAGNSDNITFCNNFENFLFEAFTHHMKKLHKFPRQKYKKRFFLFFGDSEKCQL